MYSNTPVTSASSYLVILIPSHIKCGDLQSLSSRRRSVKNASLPSVRQHARAANALGSTRCCPKRYCWRVHVTSEIGRGTYLALLMTLTRISSATLELDLATPTLDALALANVILEPFSNELSRSHKGAAGMRSVLTFVEVVWIVDARVER
jgi:hypothetical protein